MRILEAGAALSSLDILGILGLGGIPVGAPQFGLVPCDGTRFGSELRSICISEAEVRTYVRTGSALHINMAVGALKCAYDCQYY